MSDKVLVRKILPNLWQWREVQATGEWRSESFYTGDINLLKESVEGRHVVLILPGQEVVTERLPAELSDRKQLLKILPFEMEEYIIDSVDDLQFTFGPVQNGTICAAYCDFEYIEQAIKEIEETHAEVQRVVADYLQLPLAENGWTLVLDDDVVLARTGSMVGFAVEYDMAEAYLAALVQSDQPERIQVYAANQEELYRLNQVIPASLKSDDASTEIFEEEGGFWNVITPAALGLGDFRTGRLARRLPFGKWWNDFKYPAIAAGIAFVIALGTTWFGLNNAEQNRRQIMAQTDDIFRQVVPKGNISDPVRQLRGLLGSSGGAAGSSSSVYLIASVSPAIDEVGDVKVRSLRYTAENNQLQMNVEAQNFEAVEALRSKIAEAGLTAEIKNSNAAGDVFQAQLRVTEAS